jgi:hypothetical protein
MESHAYKIIPLKDLSEDPLYGLRYHTGDLALEKSVQKRGVLQPLTVEAQGRVVSGHRRFCAAQKAGLKEVPVLEIRSSEEPQDLFLVAVLSNWGQRFTEFEKAWVLHRAAAVFKIPQADILEEVAPALGMAGEKHLCAHYAEVMRLEKPLLDLMAAGKLPFRGAESLLKLGVSDQKIFAGEIAGKITLTTNQVLNAGEWLYDLMKKEGKDLAGLLEVYDLGAILNSERDGRQKAEQFFQKVRSLRYPRLTEKERRFAKLSGEIAGQLGPVSFEPPPQFEGQAITLKLRAKTSQSLEDLIETLKTRRKLLNSLFDIVL